MTEPRELPDLSNSLEWNLVARESLSARLDGSNFFIPAKNYLIDSYVVAIGVRAPLAPAGYFLAGWAEQHLLINPSPGTSTFPAVVSTGSQRIRLNVLNLVVFPQRVKPFLLELKFARWHSRVDVEIWRYDGIDLTIFEAFRNM